MESSSENSFTWTDTSSDSVNSTSMATDEINENSDENVNDGRKTKEKSAKIKHTDEPVNLEPKVVIKVEKAHIDTRSKSSVKKKRIKIESDSENDLGKKKKKIKNMETNGNQNDSQESISYDETYLNLKVKQEACSTSSSTKHKQKKRKCTSSIDSSTTKLKCHENNCSSEVSEHVTLKQETENHTVISKNKKKKSKKQYDSDYHNLDIEDKMDIEETVVYKQEQTHSINSKGTKSSVIDNIDTTLQEESDCEEISAIKSDDRHSPHTFSFLNKSIENKNTKINSCDSSNIITKLASSISEQDSIKKLEATNHRKQRISDRIRFEDDDDDTNFESSHLEHVSHSENNKKPLKLKQFLKGNPDLKLLPQTFYNNTSLTQDDEIWIVKCPREINIKDFNNKTLNIHGKCKIKIGGQTYEGSAEEEQWDTISLLAMEHNKYKIRNVPLSGIINLRRRIPKAHFCDDNIIVNNQNNFIPLPETKCRHPLFGSNYKKALKIPAAISERLYVQDSEEIMMCESRKKKKNKKGRNTPPQVDPQVQNDIIMKTEPEHSADTIEKKKEKRKRIHDESPAQKKVKRIRHDPESAEAWESEKAIEENLFNF